MPEMLIEIHHQVHHFPRSAEVSIEKPKKFSFHDVPELLTESVHGVSHDERPPLGLQQVLWCCSLPRGKSSALSDLSQNRRRYPVRAKPMLSWIGSRKLTSSSMMTVSGRVICSWTNRHCEEDV
jgi:hypothetical protein